MSPNMFYDLEKHIFSIFDKINGVPTIGTKKHHKAISWH